MTRIMGLSFYRSKKMKWEILALLLLFSFGAFAQTDSTQIESIEVPDSTGIGIPDGTPISKDIGPAGGSISSEDGMVELIFPAGALTTSTTISIQPITNLAPNGFGKSYKFEPSGIQFSKPVQIIFHYTEEEAGEDSADLMCFGLQDDKGKWTFLEFEQTDNTTRTLKGSILHFTNASKLKYLTLHPERERLNTGDVTKIFLWEVIPQTKKRKSTPKAEEANLASFRSLTNFEVNKISNGNAKVGEIFNDEDIQHTGKTRTYSPRKIYFAPKILPDENPVTITAIVGVPVGVNSARPEKKVSCKIELYDSYFITVRDTLSVWEGRGQYITDSSTFIVFVFRKDVMISEIKNYTPGIYRIPVPKFPCKMDLVLAGCIGTVDVPDKYTATRDATNPASVIIKFTQPKTVVAIRFIERCPGVKTKLTDMDAAPIPTILNFKADGDGDLIKVESMRVTRYTVWIQKLWQPNKYGLER